MTLNIVNRPDTAPAWAQTASAGDVKRPSDAFISAGWVQSAEPPYRQYFNYVLGSSAQGLKYLLQNGIPKWVSDESYPVDAVIIHDHKMWRAVRDNIGVTPGTSADDWTGVASMITDDQGNPITGGVKEIVAGDNISIEEADGVVTINATDQSGGGTGGVVQKIVAGAGVTVSPVEGTGEVTISATGGGGGGGVIPPSPGDHFLDAGFWRIIVGTGVTITGYLDTVTMPKPLGAVLAIGVTEHNVAGWGPPGPNGEVTGTVTVFGTDPHPDPDKFKLSVATWDIGQSKWVYPGLTPSPGGVSIQYIAIGENPDYVPPTPAP